MYYEASALSDSNQAGSEEYGIQSRNLFNATAKNAQEERENGVNYVCDDRS